MGFSWAQRYPELDPQIVCRIDGNPYFHANQDLGTKLLRMAPHLGPVRDTLDLSSRKCIKENIICNTRRPPCRTSHLFFLAWTRFSALLFPPSFCPSFLILCRSQTLILKVCVPTLSGNSQVFILRFQGNSAILDTGFIRNLSSSHFLTLNSIIFSTTRPWLDIFLLKKQTNE